MRNGAGERWLTLGQASSTLGVTPNTLRRWADKGQIPSFTTPGGHRRFLAAAVIALLPAKRARRPALATMGASSDRIARAYRRTAPPRQGWLGALSEADRSRFRERGLRLVGDLLGYLDAQENEAAPLMRQAEVDAREYGESAAIVGASLADAVEGFLRFRKPFVDELAALARRRHLDTGEATVLLSDAEAALDRLLVAVMTGHRAGAG